MPILQPAEPPLLSVTVKKSVPFASAVTVSVDPLTETLATVGASFFPTLNAPVYPDSVRLATAVCPIAVKSSPDLQFPDPPDGNVGEPMTGPPTDGVGVGDGLAVDDTTGPPNAPGESGESPPPPEQAANDNAIALSSAIRLRCNATFPLSMYPS